MHLFLFFYFFIFYFIVFFWVGLGLTQPSIYIGGWAQLSPTGAELGPASPARSLAQASDRLGKQLMHA